MTQLSLKLVILLHRLPSAVSQTGQQLAWWPLWSDGFPHFPPLKLLAAVSVGELQTAKPETLKQEEQACHVD